MARKWQDQWYARYSQLSYHPDLKGIIFSLLTYLCARVSLHNQIFLVKSLRSLLTWAWTMLCLHLPLVVAHETFLGLPCVEQGQRGNLDRKVRRFRFKSRHTQLGSLEQVTQEGAECRFGPTGPFSEKENNQAVVTGSCS